MHEWQSLSHVKWDCKYHVVFIPKYRKKVLYGRLRKRVGRIIRELCEQRGVDLLEGHAMPDHVHQTGAVTTQVQCIAYGGISEGQECRPNSSRVDEGETDDRATFLGKGILRKYGWPG